MKKTFLIGSVLLSLYWIPKAQAQKTGTTAVPNFMALIVNNLDSSGTWYQEVLGFEKFNQVENADRGFRQANLKRPQWQLELIEIGGSISQSEIIETTGSGRIQGFFKFGFQVDDFDHWINHLNGHEVSFHGSVVSDPGTGKRMVIVRDPDGNRIQIFEK